MRLINVMLGIDDVLERHFFTDQETGTRIDPIDYTSFDTDSDLSPEEVIDATESMVLAALEDSATQECVKMYESNLERFFIALIPKEK
jgi:hypothetical protein